MTNKEWDDLLKRYEEYTPPPISLTETLIILTGGIGSIIPFLLMIFIH